MSPLGDPSIFKAYDVRGVYGEDIDASVAHAIGRAFTRVISGMADRPASELTLGLGRDMRLQAPELAAAYRDGMVTEGAAVLDAGQVGTEMLYFLVGSRELDGGLMCTASHNPKRYTGVKLVRRGALALSGEEGINQIRDLISAGLGEAGRDGVATGSVSEVDVYADFQEAALRVIDPARIRPLKVVVDGGNGMAGPMVGPLLERLGLDLETAYWTPDGNFPDHEPNPLLPENREFIMAEVRARGADLGIAWDGDADRCFFIDETGAFVDGDFLTALMTEAMLAKHPPPPTPTVLYDVRASRAVADTAHAHGGEALVNRVGHAFFKARMREVPAAVFGGEVSGHYYFRDFYCADSGTLPALLILELLSERRVTMSALLEPYRSRYFISGEINSEVADAPRKLAQIAERYADAELTHLDGISVDYPDWHFNVRASNTEPLVRLCLESLRSPAHMAAQRDEVLALIRE
jgi:phosphomannomutase